MDRRETRKENEGRQEGKWQKDKRRRNELQSKDRKTRWKEREEECRKKGQAKGKNR